MDGPTTPPAPDDSRARAGGSISGGSAPAYRLSIRSDPILPILIAVPHGGRAYPSHVLESMRDAEAASLRLEDRHADTLACAIAHETGAATIVAEAPRAMIDLNRAPDDIDWGIVGGGRPVGTRHSLANRRARSGLGLIPRRLPGLGEIWRRPIAKDELARRIEDIHRPYHVALAETLELLRDRWGAALLVDLHSMPPLRPRFPDEHATEFVIGDRFGMSCDERLTAAALRFFGKAGKPAAHNRPYSGGYVLDRHGSPLRGLHALQIEVCRSTYLDARLAEPSARLPAVARLLGGLIRTLASEIDALGRDRRLPEAAE